MMANSRSQSIGALDINFQTISKLFAKRNRSRWLTIGALKRRSPIRVSTSQRY
jgi:hypothetical protein